MQNKTHSALVSMRPHCSVHMLEAISLHVSWMKLNQLWDGPIVFQRLAHFTTTKPSTGILCFATFNIPTFWCGMTHTVWGIVSGIISEPTFTYKSDPRFVRNCGSHNLTSPLLTMLPCQQYGLPAGLDRNESSQSKGRPMRPLPHIGTSNFLNWRTILSLSH